MTGPRFSVLANRGVIAVAGEDRVEFLQGLISNDVTKVAPGKAVWAALLTIPYGETRSYGAIALALGRPDASRAVGAANGRNPISIIVPCHRVVGSTGKLTGFAGGMTAKAQLLALERRDGELPFG